MPNTTEKTQLANKKRLEEEQAAAEREAAAQSQMQTMPPTPTEYVQNEENGDATPGANPKEENTNYDELSPFAKAGMQMINELGNLRVNLKGAIDEKTHGDGWLSDLARAAYDKVKKKCDAGTESSENNDQNTHKNNNNHNPPQASPCTKNTNEALEEISYEKRYAIMDM